MMKRVFLDTNIMLDLAMHREHFDAALAIMKGAYEGRFEIFASTLSFANIAYSCNGTDKVKVHQRNRPVLRFRNGGAGDLEMGTG